MRLRTIIIGAAVAVSLAAAYVALPVDHQCRNAGGCTARKSKNGKLVEVKFRKGDLVSSEDGWVAPKGGWVEGGWEKMQSNGPQPSACVKCHPWPYPGF